MYDLSEVGGYSWCFVLPKSFPGARLKMGKFNSHAAREAIQPNTKIPLSRCFVRCHAASKNSTATLPAKQSSRIQKFHSLAALSGVTLRANIQQPRCQRSNPAEYKNSTLSLLCQASRCEQKFNSHAASEALQLKAKITRTLRPSPLSIPGSGRYLPRGGQRDPIRAS